MDSTEPTADLELIAALIDGRLSGVERDRAVKLLADSDRTLEVFANAIRCQPEQAATKVVPISSAAGWRRWRVAIPVAAAATLTLAVQPLLVARLRSDSSAAQLAVAISTHAGSPNALVAGWESRGWAVMRGGGESRDPGRAGREQPILAFRLGVRSVDLQVALGRSDRTLASRLTDDVLRLLSAVGFSEMVAADYTELRSRLVGDTPEQSIKRASHAEQDLGEFLDSPYFAYGKWVGAAELAARVHNASFFTSTTTAHFIRSMSEKRALSAEDAAALRSIAARTDTGLGDRELDELRGLLQEIIRRRGG